MTEVHLAATLFGHRYQFRDVKDVLAKANEDKSGDHLAGIAAQSSAERMAARYVLAEITLETLRANPAVPYEQDEITRLIDDAVNESAYADIKGMQVGELREWLLADTTTEEMIKRLSNGQWYIYLKDINNGHTITQTQNYAGPRTSVEWIQEAPSLNGSVQTLANTGSVTFTNARANGFSPNLQSSQAVAMLQNGVQVSTASSPNEARNSFTVANGSATPAAPITPPYQRHSDGSIWASTTVACGTSGCPGWRELDNNHADVQIAAGAGSVFQRHSDGTIWESTGASCGSWCAGWVELDNNPRTISIVAGAGSVWQRHNDGTIWRSTGVACSSWCSGWTELDNNSATVAITANASTVYQLHRDGSIWRSTGVACSSWCSGWTELDNNSATTAISAGGSTVYQLHSNGTIWRSTGTACSGASCPGWTELDNNPAARTIAASSTTVFQLHSNGTIWRSTGAACSTWCGGWTELDNNAATVAIAVSNGS